MSEFPHFANPKVEKAFRLIEEFLRAVVTNDRQPVVHNLNKDAVSLIPASRALEANNAMMLERHRASFFSKASDSGLPPLTVSPRAINANNSLHLEGHRASHFMTSTDMDNLEMKLFLLEAR